MKVVQELGIVVFISVLVGVVVWAATRDPTVDTTKAPTTTFQPSVEATEDATDEDEKVEDVEQPQQTSFWSDNAAAIGGGAAALVCVILLVVLAYNKRTAIGEWRNKRKNTVVSDPSVTETFEQIVTTLKKKQLEKKIIDLKRLESKWKFKARKGVEGAETELLIVRGKLQAHKAEKARREATVEPR